MATKIRSCAFALGLLVAITQSSFAQLTISGQFRPRAEFRNGQGSPQVSDTAAAFFLSQRTRLNVGYSGYRYKIYTSIQDVRVWGQDASSINRSTSDANTGLMLHEAWGEISLIDTGKFTGNLSLKVGRQELVYDDVRLLGNLDWLQQGRRHDAALVKFDVKGWTAHLGAGFNQNAERKANTIYNGTPTGYAASTNNMTAMYKSMQFFYIAKKLTSGTASLLLFKDDFSKYHFAATDIEKKTPIYERKVWGRYTTGGNFFGTAFKRFGIAASAFYQGGKYRDGTSLNEYLLSLYVAYEVNKKFSIGPGVDITSGNNGTDPNMKFQRFDPLYGTPHKFWGHMDYFYVADGFGPNGLIDYYVKSKYKANDRLTLSLDVHQFELPSAVSDDPGTMLTKTLGTEVDLNITYSLTNLIRIESGYSSMFSTATLASAKVKNVSEADRYSTWAYVMISIKPEFTFK
ncbi:MAG: alginate export family protein [Chryseolinea sp.]